MTEKAGCLPDRRSTLTCKRACEKWHGHPARGVLWHRHPADDSWAGSPCHAEPAFHTPPKEVQVEGQQNAQKIEENSDGPGIVVVALAVTYAILLLRSTAQLRQAYAALAADGRPLQSAEILGPKVADANNAAVLYQSAILLLKAEPAGDKSLYERLTAHFPPSWKPDEMKELIGREAVANALSLIEQGTRRPACRLEHDYVDSLHAYKAPVIEDMRSIVFITEARSRLEAEAGRPANAWDLVLTQLRFGDSLRFDPIYDTQNVRLVAMLRACRTIQWLCETAPPDREHAQAIEDLLKRQDDINLMVRAVDAERLFIGEWFFRLPREELDKILWKEKRSNDKVTPPAVLRAIHRLSFTILAFKPRFVADHAAYLQLMRKRVQLLQGPYRDRKEVAGSHAAVAVEHPGL